MSNSSLSGTLAARPFYFQAYRGPSYYKHMTKTGHWPASSGPFNFYAYRGFTYHKHMLAMRDVGVGCPVDENWPGSSHPGLVLGGFDPNGYRGNGYIRHMAKVRAIARAPGSSARQEIPDLLL